MNGLDQVVRAMQKSVASAPELYRELIKGELSFLLPYHPELEGEKMSVQNGSPFPFCVMTDSSGREAVPIFSCEERLEESLRRSETPQRRFLCGSMPSVQVLEIVGGAGFPAVLNPGCTTGELVLPPDLLCALADGSVFQIAKSQPEVLATVTALKVADYPTDLVQRAFEFSRKHGNVRAAWIVRLGAPSLAPDAAITYQILAVIAADDHAVFHDLNLALRCGPLPGIEFGVGMINETDVDKIQTLFALAAPFFLAPDYHAPEDQDS